MPRLRILFLPAIIAVALFLLVGPPNVPGQVIEDKSWHVLERFFPPPVSRSDWLMVSQAQGGIEGWRIIPRVPLTRAQAMAFADEYRTSEVFKSVCDKSFSVYRNPDTNQMGVSRDVVPSRLLVKPWVCCEEAYETAFPALPGTAPATNDCRTLSLSALPGSPVVRWTFDGWFLAGTQTRFDPRSTAVLDRDRSSASCRPVRRMNQAESRDANGRVVTEAATINVMNCQGREIFIYEYTNRRGFRAIEPPNWGSSIGGRDFSSLNEAIQAVEKPTEKGPGANEKDRIFWGTWRGTGTASGLTIVINPDGTSRCTDSRPNSQADLQGPWARDPGRIDFISTPCRFGLWYKDGRLIDPWNNIYIK